MMSDEKSIKYFTDGLEYIVLHFNNTHKIEGLKSYIPETQVRFSKSEWEHT